ncbi:hypothetical protein [Agrococcus sp. DT81.2]|uniref:hypothetical protein n=1 Tax=Agrococcus sp. DT81.2 TaxID=3393414 RepID=UPI003CE485D1
MGEDPGSVTDAVLMTAGGWSVLAGSLVFFAGAAYGVPRVFMLRAPEERLAVLEADARAWRRSQWLYAAGPVIAALGVLTVAAGWTEPARVLASVAGAAMLVGAVLWGVTCARRGRRIAEFARGELPAGSWLGYVWLTLLGLALLGAAALSHETWIGVLLLIAAAAFTALFVGTRDIPPFAFYLVLAAFSVWTLLATPH